MCSVAMAGVGEAAGSPTAAAAAMDGVHLAKRLQTPQFVGEITSTADWKRTTIVKVKDQWQLYEMCENLHGLDNQEEIIDAVEENPGFDDPHCRRYEH